MDENELLIYEAHTRVIREFFSSVWYKFNLFPKGACVVTDISVQFEIHRIENF